MLSLKRRKCPGSAADRPNAKLRAEAQLQGGQFRLINEILYTTTSEEAMSQDQREKHLNFATIYHQGYREQMAKWPEHPLDRIVPFLRDHLQSVGCTVKDANEKASDAKAPDGKAPDGKLPLKLEPLSKKGKERRETPVVLDMGAGDCRLARDVGDTATVISVDFAPPADTQLPPERKSAKEYLKLGGFIKASAKNVKLLPDSCASAAVFSLSLMGKDWPEFVQEAFRLVKPGGILIIAEVTSRARRSDKLVRSLEKQHLKLIKKELLGSYFFIWYFRVNKKAPTPTDRDARIQSGRERHTQLRTFDAAAVSADLLTTCVYKKLAKTLPKLRTDNDTGSKDRSKLQRNGDRSVCKQISEPITKRQ